MVTRKLYAILYNVLDLCYGQNLGFEDPAFVSSAISRVFDVTPIRPLAASTSPILGLSYLDTPMSFEDGKMTDLVIFHRFSIVSQCAMTTSVSYFIVGI
ncbi:hypothetical protein MKX08_007833 [Trichoderma sp. CBMAI-0020]|nr:hypothetical protein MKX08_007833 [Trichoderma sp. CBMAI-0020]